METVLNVFPFRKIILLGFCRAVTPLLGSLMQHWAWPSIAYSKIMVLKKFFMFLYFTK